jgi:hypothetical protein
MEWKLVIEGTVPRKVCLDPEGLSSDALECDPDTWFILAKTFLKVIEELSTNVTMDGWGIN